MVGPASSYSQQFHGGSADTPCIITWKARGNTFVAHRYVVTNLHALDWNAGIRVSDNPSLHPYHSRAKTFLGMIQLGLVITGGPVFNLAGMGGGFASAACITTGAITLGLDGMGGAWCRLGGGPVGGAIFGGGASIVGGACWGGKCEGGVGVCG